jgi:hypothetical protein
MFFQDIGFRGVRAQNKMNKKYGSQYLNALINLLLFNNDAGNLQYGV